MNNGLPVSALSEFVNEVKQAPEEGVACYGVRATWESATRFQARSETMRMGGRAIARNFTWKIDEPRQLLGTNHAPTRKKCCSLAWRRAFLSLS